MSQPFIGQISLFGFNFAPHGWHFCDGSVLSIQQNTALFSLLGTFYGGNGTTNFALPDLRSRSPVGMGTGPGLPTYNIGQNGGATSIALTAANLPPHTHPATFQVASAGRTSPAAAQAGYLLASAATAYVPSAGDTFLALGAGNVTVGVNSGSSAPFSVVEPYLALNYCIALLGIYPARN